VITAVTVNAAAGVLVTPLDAAVMLVLPAAIPVAEPAALIVASVGTEDFQVTLEVRFCVLPSL
jgi:hypothetical protein